MHRPAAVLNPFIPNASSGRQQPHGVPRFGVETACAKGPSDNSGGPSALNTTPPEEAMSDKDDYKPLEQYHDMWRHSRPPHEPTPLPVHPKDHYPTLQEQEEERKKSENAIDEPSKH
jgi:hypothetical protein